MRFVTLALVAAALAQAPAQPPTFRTTTDVVQVDVVVQDKSGAFVTDLRPDEFVIREDDRPQRVEQFYFVAGRTVAAPDAAGSADPAALAAGPTAPRVLIAFFDDDHLTPAGFKRSQAAAETLFGKHLREGDVGGVVANGSMANNRLTASHDELLKAVRNAKPNGKINGRRIDERSWPRLSTPEAIRIVVNSDANVLAQAVERACTDDPSQCVRGKDQAELQLRGKAAELAAESRGSTAQTGQRLLALLNGISRFEGRKSILLFSEGFFADESWPLVKEAIAQAARVDARLYTFDARGLDRSGMSDRMSGVNPGTSDSLSRMLAQFDSESDAVNSLAVDTGGFFVRNANFFDAAVAQVAADASTYYVLGFRSDRAPDGSFRRLSVKVNRPGLSVRARRGYVATARPAATSAPSTRSTTSGRTEAGAAEAAVPEPPAEPLEPARPEGTPAARPEPGIAATRPEAVEGRTAERPAIRVRPNVEEHVRTLAPMAHDPDADAGWDAYKRGDVESARRLLSTASSRPAAAPWVYYALGQSAYALRDFSEAIAAWEHVHSSTPEFEPVYFDLVDGYLQVKDYDRATRTLHDAEKRWPTDAEVLNALGVVQVARGALDDAVGSFERAIAAAPKEAVGYFNLAKAAELRYWKNRRYNNRTGQWIANDGDRRRAIDNYTKYLSIGGPLENSVRDALSRLNWIQ